MRTALLTVLMLRMRVLRLRWGITMTGMTLASGRGVWLSVVVVGVWALLTGRAQLPAFLVVCACFGFGLLAGFVYGLIPRRPRFGIFRRPTFARVCVCGLGGGLSVPLIVVFGRLPSGGYGSPSGATSVVLLAGCGAVVLYLHAQYQRGVHRARGLPAPEQPAMRSLRAARSRLARMRYAQPPSWVSGVGVVNNGALASGVVPLRSGGMPAGGAAEAERLRHELAESESDLRRALDETGTRLTSCRGKPGGVGAQIAANRALARIIRQADDVEIN